MNKKSNEKKILEQLKNINALQALNFIEQELYEYGFVEYVDKYCKPTIDLLKKLLEELLK